MGSRTSGMERQRRQANIHRLSSKVVLTASQHKYLDEVTGPRGSPKPRSKHRCVACGTGGHRRGGFIETAPTGVGIRK